MTNISINAKYAHEMKIAISTEETRYYLQGIHVQPHPEKGALIVATDGHMMLVAHDPEATVDAPAIVQLDKLTIAECKRATKRNKATLVVNGNQARVVDANGHVLHIQAANCLIDGTYPDWVLVLPDLSDRPEPDRFPTLKSAQIALFGSLCPDVDSVHVISTGKEGTGPALVRIYDRDDIFGVLMPALRMPAFGSYPEWIYPVRETLRPAAREAAE